MQQIIQHDGSIKLLNEAQSQKLKQKLENFAQLIKKWNGLNLIARSTESDIWGWHFAEALSVLSVLESCNHPIVDFGAGGGVIGGALSLAGILIHLVERSIVKLNFLKDIAGFENAYADTAHLNERKFSLIIRGIDKIAAILEIFAKEIEQQRIETIIMFKASDINRELTQAQQKWRFEYAKFARVGLAKGNIVVLKKIHVKNV